MTEGILESIKQWFINLWSPILNWLILLEWWGLLLLFIVFCGIIGFFLPFKWIRAGLGGLILLAGAFVMGGTVMYRDLKPRVDQKKREVDPPKDDGGWFKW